MGTAGGRAARSPGPSVREERGWEWWGGGGQRWSSGAARYGRARVGREGDFWAKRGLWGGFNLRVESRIVQSTNAATAKQPVI